jgi:hypothetical protein
LASINRQTINAFLASAHRENYCWLGFEHALPLASWRVLAEDLETRMAIERTIHTFAIATSDLRAQLAVSVRDESMT